jgi:RND family efflux transporter MFP subunit
MISPIIALVSLLLFAGLSPALAQMPDTYTVKRTTMRTTAKFSGEVESPPPVTLSAPAQGEILWVKSPGQTVRKGDKVGRIDPVRARIELKGAKNRLKIAQRVLKQKEELLKLGLISRQEFLQYQASYNELKNRISLLSYEIRASELRSPTNGVTVRVLKGAGSMVAPGDAVLTIMPTEDLYVSARVPVDWAPQVRPGAGADIILSDGKRITGKVSTVSPAGQGFVHARIVPQSPLPTDLLDSMVPVEITTSQREALVIPNQAVVENNGRFFVFVISPEGKPKKREVKLGTTTGQGLVEVLTGLKEGERILVKGAYQEEYRNIKQYIHKED